MHLNIVLITFDTHGAAHMSLYGYSLPTTPNIDEFAKTATTFTNFYSCSTFTKPSILACLTSRYPSDIQVYQVSGFLRRPAAVLNTLRGNYERQAISRLLQSLILLPIQTILVSARTSCCGRGRRNAVIHCRARLFMFAIPWCPTMRTLRKQCCCDRSFGLHRRQMAAGAKFGPGQAITKRDRPPTALFHLGPCSCASRGL